MHSVPIISPQAELLLTSGGLTTHPMRERLLEMSRLAGSKSKLRVLRLADGWQPFGADDPVKRFSRLGHSIESHGAQLWSNRYLRWALGKRAAIETITLGDKSVAEFEALLMRVDLLVVPGGNTYQTKRGISRHAATIAEAVSGGLPYVGESAGSIMAGRTITPASLEPADICPDARLLHAPGLGLVDADIVVHAKGAEGGFDVPGPLAYVTRRVLSGVASDSSSYRPAEQGTPVYALNERQALSAKAGRIQII